MSLSLLASACQTAPAAAPTSAATKAAATAAATQAAATSAATKAAAPTSAATKAAATAAATQAAATAAATKAAATAAPAATKAPAAATKAPAATAASTSGSIIGAKELSFEIVITAPDNETYASKIWAKNDKLRMEMEILGQGVTMIIDPGAGAAYMIMNEEKQALKLPITQAEQQSGASGSAVEMVRAEDRGTKVGSETINGKQTDLYEKSLPEGSKLKLWVSQDNQFPVRAEIRNRDGVMTMEYKNVSLAPVADSMFTLPADVIVTDAGALLQSTPER